MTLELKLLNDGKTVFNMPLACGAISEGSWRIDSEEMKRLASLYSLCSNARRLRLMLALASKTQMRFSELMQLAMNPKLVKDLIGPMIEQGLVVHEGRGSGYRISARAFPVLTLALGLGRLLSVLENEMEGEE